MLIWHGAVAPLVQYVERAVERALKPDGTHQELRLVLQVASRLLRRLAMLPSQSYDAALSGMVVRSWGSYKLYNMSARHCIEAGCFGSMQRRHMAGLDAS